MSQEPRYDRWELQERGGYGPDLSNQRAPWPKDEIYAFPVVESAPTPEPDTCPTCGQDPVIPFTPGGRMCACAADTVPGAPIVTPHTGHLVYHCRRCDTHVTIRAEDLGDRDITTLCLCGQGAVTREPGDHSIAQPWPVKPRQPEPSDPVIDARIAKSKANRQRTEWTEET